MKRLRLFRRRRIANYWGHTDRKGSVLIVVIGLLLALMLVGITFFTFAVQEHSSAEYYADAAKVFGVPNADALFDFALDQLIIGPAEGNKQSALWPGRYSLVPNMIGMFGPNANPADPLGITSPLDNHPYNGLGINIIS